MHSFASVEPAAAEMLQYITTRSQKLASTRAAHVVEVKRRGRAAHGRTVLPHRSRDNFGGA